MKSVSKVQFGKLNNKRFYFSNGIIPLQYSHPYLEELGKEKHKYWHIHKVIQTKKPNFLKKESKVLESIPRLNILKQIFAQIPILYELDWNLIEIFKLRSHEETTDDNNVNNYFGENKKLDRLIIMDDVSGVADASKIFANFVTVSRNLGYNCVMFFMW